MDAMCYSNDARPARQPIQGGSPAEDDLILPSADGTRFGAYAVRAGTTAGAGVVVIPDPRGLHPFYKELVRRFAETGIDGIAVDYLARTAGMGDRPEGFDFMTHIRQTTPEQVAADVRAGVDYLQSAAGGSVASVFTVGFCFGGAQSWRQSAPQPGLAGAIGVSRRPAAARDGIPQMKAPLLLLIAREDAPTTPEEFITL